ncbi:MAG: DUF493 domain-containing protein [Proteobacteria bacterium]|nr:DUF493 domain-containing protein [Pseudomonadota bacterium]
MTELPRIIFPCDYPIKVIGISSNRLVETVLDIVRLHAPDLDTERMTFRDSSKGNYCAVNLFIEATGEQQLRALHQDLVASPLVKMVL